MLRASCHKNRMVLTPVVLWRCNCPIPLDWDVSDNYVHGQAYTMRIVLEPDTADELTAALMETFASQS
jgi:hypothetical protein